MFKQNAKNESVEMTYIPVCKISDIPINTGVCALIKEEQVSIFRIDENGEENLYAVSNFDPFSKANVISRGIIGSAKGVTVVASPIYKQHFCLKTGKCIEDETVSLKTWKISLEGESISVESNQTAL